MRSTAILLVVISHSGVFLKLSHPDFPFIPTPDGVDLFFVLSGFLIGSILIKKTEEDQNFNLSMVLQFLKRRWFRTLPNYFLFLFINILLIYLGLIHGELNKYLCTYFVFFQYFFKPYDFLFWESWSLCVEEWFYVLFPFCLMIVFKLVSKKITPQRNILFTILLFVLLPLLYRIFNPSLHDDVDLWYRKLALTRLDTIGFGLLGAYFYAYHRIYWEKLKTPLFVLGACFILYLINFNLGASPVFYRTFYFSVTGLSILFLLPLLNSFKTETIPFKPFQFISKISYSMYLVNIPLIQLTESLWNEKQQEREVFYYIIFWLVLILISFLVYRFFEKPFTDLRDKKTKNKFIEY